MAEPVRGPEIEALFEAGHEEVEKPLQPAAAFYDEDPDYLRCDVDPFDQARADAMWEDAEWTGDGEPQVTSAHD